jgi:hypothetical protein
VSRIVVGLLPIAVVACNTIVGFEAFERVDNATETDSGGGGSTDEDEGTTGETKDSGSSDSGTNGPRDAEAGADADAGVVVPPASTSCPASAPTSYPAWKTPPSRPKPCSQQDVQAFINNEQQSFDSQKGAMTARNAACATCVFTEETATTWGPIVHLADQRTFIAFGHCYRLAGASDACGSKAFELEWCMQKVCNVCSSGQNLSDCRDGARAGPCKTQFNATVTACESFGTIVNTTCQTSAQVVGVHCGGA